MVDLPECDLKRGTVALVLHLKHLATKHELLCINTHIFWDHKYNQIKYSQMSYLLNQISQIIDKSKDISIILCGDLNVWPDSNVIRLVYGLSPLLTYSDITTEEHKKILNYFWSKYKAPVSNMISAYEVYQEAIKGKKIQEEKKYEESAKGHPEYTCITFDVYETLDYILFTKTKYCVI